MKNALRLSAVFLVMVLCIAASSGCSRNSGRDNDVSGPATLPPAEYADYTVPDVDNGATIAAAATYANRVNGYYSDSKHGGYVLENTNMKLTYNLSSVGSTFYGLERLENPSGGVYVENTMDTYVRMTDGSCYYACTNPGRANLYDQGYYYYNLHVLDQVFGVTDDSSYEIKSVLETNDYYAVSMMDKPVYRDDGTILLTVRDNYDPYVCFRVPASKYKCSDYDAFSVTLKSSISSDAQLFYIESGDSAFIGTKFFQIKIVPDGEYHTYTVFYDGTVLKDHLKAFRLDIGSVAGEQIEVKEFALVKMREGLPCFKLDRNYNMYSDKLNECIRLVAFDATDALESVGTVTRIPKDRVLKMIIGDANGDHDTPEDADRASVCYAAFDIRDAGIFGYILGSNENYSGTLSVTVDGDDYVIDQNLCRGGKHVRNGGEVNMARRIYVDETHDFSAFLKEAYDERHPLEITVDETRSGRKNAFSGYSDLTGAYMMRINGINDFNNGYEHPLDEHKICFTVNPGDTERTIYVRGNVTTDGCIECAAVLNGDGVLLPVKVEVCKNFAKDGEELFYTDNDGQSYGLAVFPLVSEPSHPATLTLAALFEQWGNYRLKQVSSIRFHTAYYHLSLGVTETNCINLYSTASKLPDHRGLSTVYWSDELLDVLDSDGNPTGRKVAYDNQPQHCNVGSHTFLQYTDSDGVYNSYENCGRTVIGSSGPTYADITLSYLSFDRKVFQTYRHVEMPQTDENRAYYEMTCVFLEDVTVNDAINDLSLYRVEYPYEYFGFLDETNESVVTETSKTAYRTVKLGSSHPYFDLFHKTPSHGNAYTESEASCNVAFLLDSYDITIGGEKYNGGFAVREGRGSASFTLDLKGAVRFRKGDRIVLRFILMPWGDFRSEDDANVRMVWVNTLKNPIKIDAASGTVCDDKLVPTVRSDNGTDCEFTVSGGYPNVRDLPGFATSAYTKYRVSWERDYNITVKVTGLKNSGLPQIYEKAGGDWVKYEIASTLGYDGYSVSYEPDGTFTYTFVVTMTAAQARTFRIAV